MKYANNINTYIESHRDWKESLLLLRQLMSSTRMQETIKWGMPVYTVNNKNVAGFSAFKAFVGIWFFQGVFMTDPEKKLINAQEGVTKALRQWRFDSVDEIREKQQSIIEYLEEAIKNQEEGMVMKPDRNKPVEIPPELERALSENPALKDSFEKLSLTKRRDFAEHISTAKRLETQQQRLDKILPMILEGIGLHDKYKK